MRPLIPLFFVLVTNVYAQGARARELGIAALIGGTPEPLLAATTTTGADDYRVYALPRDRLLSALRKYGR